MLLAINFYPRPPRGGRHIHGETTQGKNEFLPTPSARRATAADVVGSLHILISTHALREEGDQVYISGGKIADVFLPTPSARRATHFGTDGARACAFLPTPSARRATW